MLTEVVTTVGRPGAAGVPNAFSQVCACGGGSACGDRSAVRLPSRDIHELLHIWVSGSRQARTGEAVMGL